MSPARAEDGLDVVASLRLRRAMVNALRQTVEVVLVLNMVETMMNAELMLRVHI